MEKLVFFCFCFVELIWFWQQGPNLDLTKNSYTFEFNLNSSRDSIKDYKSESFLWKGRKKICSVKLVSRLKSWFCFSVFKKSESNRGIILSQICKDLSRNLTLDYKLENLLWNKMKKIWFWQISRWIEELVLFCFFLRNLN